MTVARFTVVQRTVIVGDGRAVLVREVRGRAAVGHIVQGRAVLVLEGRAQAVVGDRPAGKVAKGRGGIVQCRASQVLQRAEVAQLTVVLVLEGRVHAGVGQRRAILVVQKNVVVSQRRAILVEEVRARAIVGQTQIRAPGRRAALADVEHACAGAVIGERRPVEVVQGAVGVGQRTAAQV